VKLPRSGSHPRRVQRRPPIRGCRECGAPVASWRTGPLCRACVRKLGADRPAESLREFRRRLKGEGPDLHQGGGEV
jgi:ribosomal protein S14